jgi:hypothetical protein
LAMKLHVCRPSNARRFTSFNRRSLTMSAAGPYAKTFRCQTDSSECSYCFAYWPTYDKFRWTVIVGRSKVWWPVQTKFGSSCVRRSERAVTLTYHRPLEKP